jgi:predicted AlkP superfamily phosphohydrolase/phosphomutase
VSIEKEYHAARLPDLDWQRTNAWVPSSSGSMAGYADIFFAESLSEERIDQLIQDLKAIRDPLTGQQLVREVYREDAFGKGEYAPGERHLVVLANDGFNLATDLGRTSLWDTRDKATGIHQSDGVLYLYGANVKKGVHIAPAHIYDVVPTILSHMGLPLPPELEGKVVAEAFEQPETASGLNEDGGVVLKKLKKLATPTTSGSQTY